MRSIHRGHHDGGLRRGLIQLGISGRVGMGLMSIILTALSMKRFSGELGDGAAGHSGGAVHRA